MDVTYFLKIRTDFIKFYYSEAVKSFLIIQKSIDEKKSPFNNPSYDESGEPPFLEEWMDSELGKDMVGFHCVSLLSESIKVYFDTLWKRVLAFKPIDKKLFVKEGFLSVYKCALGNELNIDWLQAGIDFNIIEQVVLARNNVSHGQKLNDMWPDHDKKTLKKYKNPFFTTEFELGLHKETKDFGNFSMIPNVHVSEDQLLKAIDEIEKVASVIDRKIWPQRL